MPFGGVKLLELPIRVVGATDNSTQNTPVLFHGTFGIAFVDSFFIAFLLREMLAGVLGGVQFLGGRDDLNIERICKVVRHFHEHFSREVDQHHGQDSDLEFFLGGFCPASNRVRVFKFHLDGEPENRVSQSTEILTGNGCLFECIGAPRATQRFSDLMELNLAAPPCRCHFAALRRLRDVIDDPTIRFVAGAIQYGEFNEDGNFRVIGSTTLLIQDGRLEPKWFSRGTVVESVYQPDELLDLHLTGSFIAPFHEDVSAFRAQTVWNADGTGHALDELITIVPFSNEWRQTFEEEREFMTVLGNGITAIEHVGSTAVDGIAAQPVVDMLVGVSAYETVSIHPLDLRPLGYDFLGEAGFTGRLFYRKRASRQHPTRVNTNLYIVQMDGDLWKNHLKLRDYLCAHPEEAKAYSRHKIECLNRGAWTLLSYRDRRSAYFDSLVHRALGWRDSTL